MHFICGLIIGYLLGSDTSPSGETTEALPETPSEDQLRRDGCERFCRWLGKEYPDKYPQFVDYKI
jgi:hypothetical protein